MSIATTLPEEERFAKEVWSNALARLVSIRRQGEVVRDEGDFVAREVDQAYMERAMAEGAVPGHA